MAPGGITPSASEGLDYMEVGTSHTKLWAGGNILCDGNDR